MTVLAEHGSFTGSGAGTEILTSFGAETPKAIIVLTAAADGGGSWGFCDALLNQACMIVRNRNARGTTNAARRLTNQYVGGHTHHNLDQMLATVTIDSVGAGQFTYTSVGFGTTIQYLALGGTSLEVKFLEWTSTRTTPGTLAVNGVGFQGNCALTIYNGDDGYRRANGLNSGFGLWGPGNASVFSSTARNNQGTAEDKYFYDDLIPLLLYNPTGSLWERADALRWTADGFELDYTNVTTTNHFQVSLVMKAPATKLGKFVAPSTPGSLQEVLGFTPAASIFLTNDATSDQDIRLPNSRWSSGLFDGSSTSGNSYIGQDAVGTSNTLGQTHTRSIEHLSPSSKTMVGEASAAFNGDNLELTYSTVDGLAYRVHHLTLGVTSGPVPIPLSGSIRSVADTAGDLVISTPVPLAGSITAVSETAGDLTISHPLAAISTAVSETAGDLTISHPLAAISTAVADTAGDLTISTPGGLAGNIQSVADTAGDLAISTPVPIAGSVTAVADTAGELNVSHPLAATSTAVSDTAGNLTISTPGALAGNIRAVAASDGDLAITAPSGLAGTITAVADTAGDVTITHPLVGTLTAVANTAGDIPVGVFTPNPCRVCTPADSTPTCIAPDSNPTCTASDSNPTHISTEC